MQITFARRRFGKIWWQYTLAFIPFALSFFGVFLLTGHTLIWEADAATQHLPILQQFYRDFWYWMSHLSQGPSLWSWHMGLGSDILGVYTYYVVGDIFSYPALFVPYHFLPTMFAITNVVRLYCVGLSFCYLANHFKLSNKAIIAGAITYISSGFIFYAAIAQPFFMNPLIQFPLLILASEKYFHQKKRMPLIGMFFWVFINNFYFAYLQGIGYGVYLLIRMFAGQKSFFTAVKKQLKAYIHVAVYALLGAMMAAVVLLPAIISIHNSVRSTDSVFANGMSWYPVLYYFQLPVRFIALGGGGSYWASLIFVAPTFLACCFIWKRRKQYPIITWSLFATFIFLLFPQAAAVFNGFSSPYNRWTMLAFLPIALAVALFIQKVGELTPREFRFISIATIVYTVILFVVNFVALMVSINALFLLGCSWALLMYTYYHKDKLTHAKRLMVVFIIFNACLNALLTTLPLFGNWASSGLTFGEYKYNNELVYAGLDKKLTKTTTYRVNTLADNYVGAGNVLLDNTLNNKLSSVSSFYSVIDKAYGSFATAVGNAQYNPIKPLRQLDNRTILDNFLGVKYIFVQEWRKNATAMPAGYKKVATTATRGKANRQTAMYETTNNLPLLWWSNRYISQKTSNALTQSQREYMLQEGVQVPAGTNTNGLKQATLPKNAVQTVKYYIVNPEGKRVSPKNIVADTTQALGKYRIVIENAGKYKNSELHVEITNSSFTAKSTWAMMSSILSQPNQDTGKNGDKTRQIAQNNNGDLQSPSLISELKKTLLGAGVVHQKYAISINAPQRKDVFYQPGTNSLPNYLIRKNAVLNLGYYQKSLPAHVNMYLSSQGTYRFNMKVVAVNLGQTYQKAVKLNQRNGLTNIKKTHNSVFATLNHPTSGMVTSTIPYSSGWKAYVDGKQVTVYQTNYGFVGFKVPSGRHEIKLTYMSPGLKLGALLTLVGVMLLPLVIWGEDWYLNRHQRQ